MAAEWGQGLLRSPSVGKVRKQRQQCRTASRQHSAEGQAAVGSQTTQRSAQPESPGSSSRGAFSEPPYQKCPWLALITSLVIK